MGDRLAEIEGDRDEKTLKENEESLAESKGDTDDQAQEENEGRATEGNITRDDLLREQTESLAEIEGDTGDQTLAENEGREDEGIRTDEDFIKDQIEMFTGMKRCIEKLEEDVGVEAGSMLRMSNLAKEQINRFLRSARKFIDPTVQNTTGITDDRKELEDFLRGQIDLMNAIREIHDPTIENIKGRIAGGMELMADTYQEQLDKLGALNETEHPKKEDNEDFKPHMKTCVEYLEDIRGPLAKMQVNVDDWETKFAESIVLTERALDMRLGLPPEIRRMDELSQQLFREALEAGKEKVYNIRLMVVGHLGVGKTTLTKRILGEDVEEAPHVSTEGIEVHPRCGSIDLDTKEWIVEGTEQRFPDTSQLLVNIVTGHVGHKSKHSTDGENQVKKKQNAEQEKSGSAVTGGAFPASFEPNIHEINTVIYRRRGDTWIKKNTRNSDLYAFVKKNRTKTHSEKIFCYVTMLDFAGQFAFYSTHQAFMSWRTIYLLVTDMSKGLDDVVKDDKFSMNLNRNIERSIKDYAVFWLNSIYSHGITEEASPQREGSTLQETGNHEEDCHGEGKYPPVILVATHSDKVPGGENEETKEKYFDGVRKILKERPLRFLLKGNFALSNFGPETDIDALKQKIVELAEQQEYWGEEIPGRWLALEQKLMELKRSGKKIIEYSRVEEINNQSDVRIENPNELELFLRFEHDLGNVVFFRTSKLREKVVLDPEWLMDGVKILMSPPRHVREDPYIYPQVHTFWETGLIAKSLIGSMWSGSEHEDFHRNQDHLLDLLEKLSIIAKSVQHVEKEYYWVPCVIYKSAPDHVTNPKPYEGMTKTSTLCFESKTKFVHVGIFHRLVASFLSMWTPVWEEEGREYHLYHGCCVFDVDQCHNLLLVLNDYVILATMLRYSSEGECPDNKLCNTVRNLISSTLADIATCICPNSTFDICVKCEKSSIDTINGLHRITDTKKKKCTCTIPTHEINVESLLKIWEVGPEQPEMVYEDSEYINQEELHITVLNHCRLQLIKDLHFESVFPFIYQKGFIDDVTMRDISEQKTTTEKMEMLIARVKQGCPNAYAKFKDCLVQAKETRLLEKLMHEEAEFQSHGKKLLNL